MAEKHWKLNLSLSATKEPGGMKATTSGTSDDIRGVLRAALATLEMEEQGIQPSVQTIVETWLSANGYDGLYQPTECACCIGNLFPCENPGCIDCEPGYKTPGDEEYEFFIGPDKADGASSP